MLGTMLLISAPVLLSVATIFHLPQSLAAPVLQRQSGQSCTSPSLRQEWSSVSQAVRDEYISAALCLSTKPSRIGLNTTLYDDFPYVHNALNNKIHFVAQFLPWHRYFVHIYEQSLIQCGYTGSALYWDWTKDSQNPSGAAIWDATTGIGGNGNRSIPDSQPRCLVDGPFEGLRPAYTVGDYDPHCLSRDWNDGSDQVGDMLGADYSPAVIATVNQAEDYPTFHTKLENGAHGAIHSAIGGDMSPATSPNGMSLSQWSMQEQCNERLERANTFLDPVFFLHHTQIDRLWWLWQSANASRITMYGGNRFQLSADVTNSTLAELTDMMVMLGMATDIPVSNVMSTKTNLLCYTY